MTRAEREAFPVQIAQQTLAVSECDVKRAEAAKSWTLTQPPNVSRHAVEWQLHEQRR